MQALAFLSPRGRLQPQPFLIAVAVVYVAGAASYWLTGLLPFAAAHGVLTWLWFVLHARRLHDAGRGSGLVVAVALLYVLSLGLLLILADGFVSSPKYPLDASATSALELIVALYIVMTLVGSVHYDLTWIVAGILTLFAFVPVVVAFVFTLWTATRPSVEQPSSG